MPRGHVREWLEVAVVLLLVPALVVAVEWRQPLWAGLFAVALLPSVAFLVRTTWRRIGREPQPAAGTRLIDDGPAEEPRPPAVSEPGRTREERLAALPHARRQWAYVTMLAVGLDALTVFFLVRGVGGDSSAVAFAILLAPAGAFFTWASYVGRFLVGSSRKRR